MKINITKVVRKDTDKEGNKLVTKDGRPYTRIMIQCQEYGQKWITGFASPWNASWADGQTVEAEVVQKGEYLNLEKPDPLAQVLKQLNDLATRMTKMEQWARNYQGSQDENPF